MVNILVVDKDNIEEIIAKLEKIGLTQKERYK